MTQFLRKKEVLRELGFSNATLHRLRKSGHFPEPRILAGTAIKVWPREIVDEWLQKATEKTAA